MRVLIAEDNFLIAEDISSMIRENGHEVIGIVNDGIKAVSKAFSEKPDIIIMDIKMGEMDGLEASRIIQEKLFIPIVIVTAYTSKDHLQQAIHSGVGAFLSKPVSSDDINSAMEIAVAHGPLIKHMRYHQIDYQIDSSVIEIEKSIVPICMYCKKIRKSNGEWVTIEKFISDVVGSNLSHGCCPSCSEQVKEEIDNDFARMMKKKSI